MTEPNPLLADHALPAFSKIMPEHVVPAIQHILADNRTAVAGITETNGPYTWTNLVAQLEDLEDRLSKAWSPVAHLNAVMNSEAMRDAYNACLPLLSDYHTEIGQNSALYQAYHALAEGDNYAAFSGPQRKIVEDALRDFRLSGVALPEANKARFKEIAQELSTLTSRFQDNLLDATNAWSKQLDDTALLAGIPESARNLARQKAEAQGKSGWIFNLEFPSYLAVMTYADDPDLRREFYTAYTTRASDQGPHAGRWDNSEVMEKILALRHEEANLLGYSNYAELSLATKMARSTDEVMKFLTDLADRALPVARRDLEELQVFARERDGIGKLAVWDLGYYSEKLRQHRFDFSEEEVRAYFPADRVVSGMFAVAERLYGIRILERQGIDVWHPDVRFYEILGDDNEVRGSFYLDLYARERKRGGAWMDECITRRKIGEAVQLPVAYLTCNFTPPTADTRALLRHEEVLTLFHEFGHGMHHLLTRMDHLGVSGIHGVEWDAVELPSQFMENFCWDREALALISGHYQTGKRLPDALFAKMLAARNFQSGMQLVRQLEFSLFDFRLHLEYQPAHGGRIPQILDEVRRRVAVVIPPAFNRFQHSFSHIFSGGYAAGYYSYKWAEVLSSDAFALFEERGVLDRNTGLAFLRNILEQGGSRKAMDLFVGFRGREPEIDALLRHSGLLSQRA